MLHVTPVVMPFNDAAAGWKDVKALYRLISVAWREVGGLKELEAAAAAVRGESVDPCGGKLKDGVIRRGVKLLVLLEFEVAILFLCLAGE